MNVIIVEVAGGTFALPVDTVREVVDPVPVTPVPFVPAFVEGVVGLGGIILPQIDLRRRLGREDAAPAATSEILVVEAPDGACALRIDRALMLATIASGDFHAFNEAEPGEAEPGEPEVAPEPEGAARAAVAAGLPGDLIAGEFGWRDRTVLVLRSERLGLQGMGALRRRGGGDRLIGQIEGAEGAAHTTAQAQRTFFIVASGTGLFAFPVDQVAEVVAVETITPVPRAPAEVDGVTLLRGWPLLVLSFARLLGRRGTAPDGEAAADGATLIVMAHPQGRFALRIDRVIGIRRFAAADIHESAGAGTPESTGYLVDGRDRIIGLLDCATMIAPDRFARYRKLLPRQAEGERRLSTTEASRTLLTFHIGPEWYALDLDRVERITEYHGRVPVPATARSEVAGVTEVGGEILPVADLRVRLGADTAVTDMTAIIVVKTPAGRWALVVDRVDRLVDLPASDIQAAGGAASHLVAEIGRLNGRLLSVLNPAALFPATPLDKAPR